MELIGTIILAVLAIIGTAISKQITDEFKAWMPSVVRHLINYAVQLLRQDQRERFAEEWSSHVNDVPGEIGKLVVAFGFVRAAWKMSPDLQQDLPFAACKRAIDVFFSGVCLALLAPTLACFAIVIKLDTPGPIFFVRAYYGHKNKLIRMARFRTLPIYDPKNPQGLGVVRRLLRGSPLEQLPQLFSVLKGDISLVGPRPRPISQDDPASQYDLKPGITGLTQIRALRGELDEEDAERIAECDAWYAENRTILLDLKILLATFFEGLCPTPSRRG